MFQITNLLRLSLLLSLAVGLAGCALQDGDPSENTAAVEVRETPQLETLSTSTPTITPIKETSTQEVEDLEPASPSNFMGEGVITIWHGLEGDRLLALDEIVTAYEKLTPGIRLELTYVPYDDLYDRYVKAIRAGSGPSMMLGAGEWGPQLYDLKVLADLSASIPLRARSVINPPALKGVSYREALIGIPYVLSGVVMYRNNAIIPEAPASFQELIKISRDVSKGKQLGAYLERGVLFALPQLSACGGELMYSNGMPAFNNQTGFCWFELLQYFENAGPVSVNQDDDLDRFISGKVGIIMDGTWNLSLISESLGELLEVDPWPAYQGNHLSGYVWSENIFANPDLDAVEMKMVGAFSEFLLSQASQRILADTGLIPATIDVEVPSLPIAQAITALSLGIPYPSNPEMLPYWKPLQDALNAVFHDGMAISEALQIASEAITKATKDFKNTDEDL